MSRPHKQGGYWYKNALATSDLKPLTRLVGYALETLTDTETATATVALSYLVARTGMSKSALAEHLNLLENAKFVERARPETWKQMQRREMTRYTVVVPAGYPVKASPVFDSSSPSHGHIPVRETEFSSPRDGHRSIRSIGADARSAGASPAPRSVWVEEPLARPHGRPKLPCVAATAGCVGCSGTATTA
jgi:hypothetical protein